MGGNSKNPKRLFSSPRAFLDRPNLYRTRDGHSGGPRWRTANENIQLLKISTERPPNVATGACAGWRRAREVAHSDALAAAEGAAIGPPEAPRSGPPRRPGRAELHPPRTSALPYANSPEAGTGVAPFNATSMFFDASANRLLLRWEYLSVVTIFAWPNIALTS